MKHEGRYYSAFFLFLSFFLFPTLSAQNQRTIDSLQNRLRNYDAYKREMQGKATPLMDSNRVNIMYAIMLEYFSNKYDSALSYCNQIMQLSEHMGYPKGIGAAYNGMGLVNMQMRNYATALQNYQRALQIRTAIGDKAGVGWTYNNMGLMYGNMGKLEEAIKYHTLALQVRQEIGDSDGMEASYGKIGHAYAWMGKFPEAVSNYLSALKIGEEDSDRTQVSRFFGDIGDIYFNEGNYEEALLNYRQALKNEQEIGDTIPIAYGENKMGRIFYKQGNYAIAIKYLLASLKIYRETGDVEQEADIHYNLGLVYLAIDSNQLALSHADTSLEQSVYAGAAIGRAGAYIEIGSVYEKMGRLQAAFDSVAKGLALAEKTKARVQMRDANMLLADISAKMGNYKDASGYYQNYIINLDSINNNESAKKIETLEMNYAFAKREDSIQDEIERNNIIKAAEIKRKSIVTDSAIIISVLILLASALLVRNLQLKRKKEKLVFENDKHRMERELVTAQTALNEYTRNMAEKNKLLEEFKTEVEEFKTINDIRRTENLEYLNKATILTDEDWNKFKQLFEQVHKDFLKRLKEKLPDLTHAETRLVCLTKLNIGTKQMAAILGVSYDTVKKSRHRFRKKLGLTEEDSIDDIVNSI